MTKFCRGCGKMVAFEDFSLHDVVTARLQSRCVLCRRARQKAIRESGKHTISCKRYENTFTGMLMRMYNHMKYRRGLRRSKPLSSRLDFYRFALAFKGLKQLYRAWYKSGKSPDLKPTLIRVNPDGGYSTANISFCTKKEFKSTVIKKLKSRRAKI